LKPIQTIYDPTLEPVEILLQRAQRYPLLDHSEVVVLAQRIEAGDLVAKEKLINHNLRLVVSVARNYQGQGLTFGDLVQEGMLGLIRAAEKYDYRKGFRFSTYATIWIRQALQRGLDNTGRTIRLPAPRARTVPRPEDGGAEAGERHPHRTGEAEEGSEGQPGQHPDDPARPAGVRPHRQGLRHASRRSQVRPGEDEPDPQPVPDIPVEDDRRPLRAPTC